MLARAPTVTSEGRPMAAVPTWASGPILAPSRRR